MEAHVRSYAVAHLPGDGIGPEVTAVAQGPRRPGWQAARLQRRLAALPARLRALPSHRRGAADEALEDLRTTDAILLGAVGSPSVPPGVLERGLLLRLRFDLDLYVNLRPARQRPGVAAAGAADLDFVVVRENTEGLYAGAGGIAHQGSPFEVATEESLNTRAGVERCVRYAAGPRQAPERQAHPRPQDQRARQRRQPVDAGRPTRSRRRWGFSSTTPTSTRLACIWSATLAGST